MSSLTSEKYTSLQESYDVLVDYVISALDTDTAFFKKMYKYMINAGSISGRQVCMLLYEQGVLDMNADDSKYQSLASGSMGAYEFMSYVISNKIITVGQLALKPCSGSAVVTNPDNGDVLALVSYPMIIINYQEQLMQSITVHLLMIMQVLFLTGQRSLL